MSYWTIRRSVKKTLARHINEIQTQSSQENYGDITTHSPEYAGPSNIGESSNNLNMFDRKPRAEKKKKRTERPTWKWRSVEPQIHCLNTSLFDMKIKMHKCALFSF